MLQSSLQVNYVSFQVLAKFPVIQHFLFGSLMSVRGATWHWLNIREVLGKRLPVIGHISMLQHKFCHYCSCWLRLPALVVCRIQEDASKQSSAEDNNCFINQKYTFPMLPDFATDPRFEKKLSRKCFKNFNSWMNAAMKSNSQPECEFMLHEKWLTWLLISYSAIFRHKCKGLLDESLNCISVLYTSQV